MKETQIEFLNIMDSMKKLNIGSMMPGVNPIDFHIIKIIHSHQQEHEQVRVSTIVKEMKAPPPAVSRCLRGLEEKGYIIRSVDTKDRRNTYVELTAEGEALVVETETIMTDFAEAVLGQMGEERLQQLNQIMLQLIETAQREIEARKYKGERGTENEAHI